MCVQIHIAAVLYLEMIQGEQIDWFGGFFFKMSWAILPSPLALGYKLLADSSLSLRFHMQSVSADWWWIWIILVLFLKADEKSKHAAALGINPLVADSCFWQIGNTANRPG